MYNNFKILLFLFVFLYVYGQELEVDDKCDTKDEQRGVCRLLMDCPVAVETFRNHGLHNLTRCGFKGFMEIICCPVERLDSKQESRQPGNSVPNFGPESSPTPILEEGPETKKPEIMQRMRPAARACKRIVQNTVPPLQDHIIGGESASIGEFPHMAALGFLRRNKTHLAFLCGGTLISDRHVITAAHCLGVTRRSDPDRIPVLVRLGVLEMVDSPYNETVDYNITKLHVHPEYRQFYNDIGILMLGRQVRFDYNLQPACMPTTPEMPEQMVITGWGVTNFEDRSRLSILQKATVRFVDQETCNKTYSKFKLGITEKMICALDRDGKDACQGDSGGPLQAVSKDGYFRIYGVTSFGHGCGSKVPGVYTRVFSYLDWVESIVWPDEQDLQMNPQ